MHIGVDVRNLSGGPVTGIARVLIETVLALSDQGARFTFYWPGPRRPSPLDAIAGAHHVQSVFQGPVGRQVWGHAVLARAVAQTRPEIFWGPAHRLPPFLPATIPAVLTIHDLVWHHAPRTMTLRGRLADSLLMRGAVARADAVVAVSKSTARDIAEVFGRTDTRIVYPGVTLRQPASTPETLLDRHGLVSGRYGLFVGTLEPRKNLVGLLRAYREMRAVDPHAPRLAVVGAKGWRDSAINAELAPLVDAGHVRVLGYVEDGDLATLYAHARFLAMPSLYEGFGLPVVEAQSHGVPVLVSSAGSLPEIAGAGALVADPRDSAQMARAMAALWSDAPLHARLSIAARENARRFSWPQTARAMLEVFRSVLP